MVGEIAAFTDHTRQTMRLISSLVPRPSITANMVEGLVKPIRRMTSGRRLGAWHKVHHQDCSISPVHDPVVASELLLAETGSATPPDVYLTSFYIGVLPGLPWR